MGRREELSIQQREWVVSKQPKAFVVSASQVAHGFAKGLAVYLYDGVWALYSSGSVDAVPPINALVGIVVSVFGADSFTVCVGGEAKVTATGLAPGQVVTFTSGVAATASLSQYPPPGYAATNRFWYATSPKSVLVVNDSISEGLMSHAGSFAVVSHASIGIGHYVVYAGVPSGQVPLALADEANPWKWTNVGIALFEVGGSGTWLVLISGNHTHGYSGIGDTRPAWMTSAAYNDGQRIYLSSANAGQYSATEPTFKVYAGISSASYVPASFPTPEYVSFSATSVSQGVPYPIPASGGGTGTDVSLLNEHSVLYMDTYGSPATRKIAGLLSLTSEYSAIVQKSGAQPTHLTFDLVANGSFVESGGNIYAAAGGKRFSTTAPTDKQFERYDSGTERWTPYGPLLTAVGQTLGHDGTDLVTVDCSTAYSVIGRAANSAGAFAPIVATAANELLYRGSSSLAWLTAPATTGHILKYNGTTLAWLPGPQTSSTAFSATSSDVTGTFTVPAGVYEMTIIVVAGGGGGGGYGTLQTVGYIAASSGGSPTTALQMRQCAGGGGAGALIVIRAVVLPGDSIPYKAGARGTYSGIGTNGSAGSSSYVTLGSDTITANPGQGGTVGGLGGQGGVITGTSCKGVSYGIGQSGGDGGIDVNASITGAGGKGGMGVAIFQQPAGSTLVYAGDGGVGGSPGYGVGANGLGGAVVFFY
jgi:hypothetical protein